MVVVGGSVLVGLGVVVDDVGSGSVLVVLDGTDEEVVVGAVVVVESGVDVLVVVGMVEEVVEGVLGSLHFVSRSHPDLPPAKSSGLMNMSSPWVNTMIQVGNVLPLNSWKMAKSYSPET